MSDMSNPIFTDEIKAFDYLESVRLFAPIEY